MTELKENGWPKRQINIGTKMAEGKKRQKGGYFRTVGIDINAGMLIDAIKISFVPNNNSMVKTNS